MPILFPIDKPRLGVSIPHVKALGAIPKLEEELTATALRSRMPIARLSRGEDLQWRAWELH
jgi:hypothetical protein